MFQFHLILLTTCHVLSWIKQQLRTWQVVNKLDETETSSKAIALRICQIWDAHLAPAHPGGPNALRRRPPSASPTWPGDAPFEGLEPAARHTALRLSFCELRSELLQGNPVACLSFSRIGRFPMKRELDDPQRPTDPVKLAISILVGKNSHPLVYSTHSQKEETQTPGVPLLEVTRRRTHSCRRVSSVETKRARTSTRRARTSTKAPPLCTQRGGPVCLVARVWKKGEKPLQFHMLH